MNIEIGSKTLITTEEWFIAPDGQDYKSVFGTVKAVRTSEESLGVKTNSKSTNWYLEIGNMTIAGCQIKYLVKCDNPNLGHAQWWSASPEHGVQTGSHPSKIYNADCPV